MPAGYRARASGSNTVETGRHCALWVSAPRVRVPQTWTAPRQKSKVSGQCDLEAPLRSSHIGTSRASPHCTQLTRTFGSVNTVEDDEIFAPRPTSKKIADRAVPLTMRRMRASAHYLQPLVGACWLCAWRGSLGLRMARRHRWAGRHEVMSRRGMLPIGKALKADIGKTTLGRRRRKF